MTAPPDPAAAPLPPEGIRVCDFSWIVAGPQATSILADLGAEVIKVENADHIDSVRLMPGQPGPNRRGMHNNFNRNKLSITANLGHAGGRDLVERLIAVSDLVVENFSPGAFGRMGFPYERLRELRPDIVYLSVAGEQDATKPVVHCPRAQRDHHSGRRHCPLGAHRGGPP